MADPRPPGHLSAASRRLWAQLAEDYDLHGEPHALRVLTLAAEALDRCTDARKAIKRHGTVYVDRFGAPKVRPEVAIERDSRIAAIRAFRELSLDGALPEARMPRVGGGRS